jgi:hypothetical protein
MLCGVSVLFNSLCNVLGLMSCKRSSENGQVFVGFQSTEAFGCLHHAGGGPRLRRTCSHATHNTSQMQTLSYNTPNARFGCALAARYSFR